MITDCNTLFGYWQKDTQDRSVERLSHIMRTNGIERALTCSGRGVWDDFVEGNEETLRVCAEHPELLPVGTVRPGDYYRCVEEIGSLRGRGFRMVRLFPATQGWGVGSLGFRRLLEALVESELPVFIDNGYDSTGLIAPLVDYFQGTEVPLIFSGVSYGFGEFLAACEVYEHCYMDTWQSFLLNQIELVRDAAGIGRVLLGTKAPFEMPGPCLEMVRHGRLTEEEKAAVLAGNVGRLMGESGMGNGESGESAAARVDQASGRRGMCGRGDEASSGMRSMPTTRLIDVHAHYGPWVGLPNPYVGIEDLVGTCERYGIEHICLSSTLAIGYDMVEGNARLAAAIEGREGLHGYVVIHPGYAAESLAQMKEYFQNPQFVGAKLHPKHAGYQIDCDEARPLLEYLVEVGKPLLEHTWFDEMCLATGNAADLFPELVVIMGHMGGDTWEKALEVAAERPNVYLELCSGLSPWGKLERAVAMVGAERLLFGTDLTLLEPGYTLGLVTGAEIGERAKRMILYENGKRLMGF
ncbi:MAG: amidohydrolase family protein [Armatimonadia bacterium]